MHVSFRVGVGDVWPWSVGTPVTCMVCGMHGVHSFCGLVNSWGPWNDRHRPAMPNDRRTINVRSGPSSKMVSRIGGVDS